jgi:hypothetical protein
VELFYRVGCSLHDNLTERIWVGIWVGAEQLRGQHRRELAGSARQIQPSSPAALPNAGQRRALGQPIAAI